MIGAAIILAQSVATANCDLSRIKPGMPAASVTTLCGQPSTRQNNAGIVKWVYVNPGNAGFDIIWFTASGARVRIVMHTLPDKKS
jgi:hypothetical protein